MANRAAAFSPALAALRPERCRAWQEAAAPFLGIPDPGVIQVHPAPADVQLIALGNVASAGGWIARVLLFEGAVQPVPCERLTATVMTNIQTIAKAVIPAPARRSVRKWHREFTFHRAMKRFRADPRAALGPDDSTIAELIYGWGNEGWSASTEFLRATIERALATTGPVLECGSGLSTLLLGTIAQQRGHAHWALEHSAQWGGKLQERLDRYRLDAVRLQVGPLRDYGAFCWYDLPPATMPSRFELVVCDGPPGSTKGGRYGLVPVLGERLSAGCVILVDDAQRDEERAIATRWAGQLASQVEVLGKVKPYIMMLVGSTPTGLTPLPRAGVGSLAPI